MRVKLIASTPFGHNIAYIAARTCYSEASPYGMSFDHYGFQECIKLLKQCYKSGHHSVFEHIQFTFAIDGISRACSHQLVRHRHCTFSQQSQRYVNMEDCDFIQPNGMSDKAFETFTDLMRTQYKALKDSGMKNEDARAILPNCTSTNLVMTCNLRELIHICNLRMCTRAQKEIRQLVNKMVAEVIASEYHWCQDMLVPKCEINGYCTEHKCCGRKPKLELS